MSQADYENSEHVAGLSINAYLFSLSAAYAPFSGFALFRDYLYNKVVLEGSGKLLVMRLNLNSRSNGSLNLDLRTKVRLVELSVILPGESEGPVSPGPRKTPESVQVQTILGAEND
ncbi:hypothetical protein BGY98DRAFT_933655 [Russula aff. rugulosa BPL654]|nr:hypothetical protein BGY98DRAFT_933655 [Russula aff. rugulosa BPL654]